MPTEHHDTHRPDPGRSAWTDLGSGLSEATARDWGLVLKAGNIPSRTLRQNPGWRVLVPAAHLARALDEIRAWEEENPPRADASAAPPPPRPRSPEAWGVAVVMLLGLVHYMITTSPLPGLGLYPEGWMSRGAADSALILGGEVWRAATALTLHADPAHFLANAVLGGVLVACLCRAAGFGPAWLLFMASGTLGNLVNAWMRGPGHLCIGASTAVFGVAGALAALAMVRRGRPDFRSAGVPLAAGLALLGMLGTGDGRTDLGAHLFGFLSGLPLGLAAGLAALRLGPPGRWASRLMGLAALGLLLAAWSLAWTA
ncbi:rhomboid family intramembrane serine protease [Desulfocurvus sp. DL9XJH121]